MLYWVFSLVATALLGGYLFGFWVFNKKPEKVPARDRYLIAHIENWEVKITMNGSNIGLDIGTHRTGWIEDVGNLDVPLIFWVKPSEVRKLSAKLLKAADIIEPPGTTIEPNKSSVITDKIK